MKFTLGHYKVSKIQTFFLSKVVVNLCQNIITDKNISLVVII